MRLLPFEARIFELKEGQTYDTRCLDGDNPGIPRYAGAVNGMWAPVIVLVVILATDLGVYADAKAHSERGTPIVFAIGGITVDTPAAWFIGCLVLWILFFPLYMTQRRHIG